MGKVRLRVLRIGSTICLLCEMSCSQLLRWDTTEWFYMRDGAEKRADSHPLCWSCEFESRRFSENAEKLRLFFLHQPQIIDIE
jgi:hypothetical protein